MKLSEKITIFIGIALVGIFVMGLAWSISTGLAGFYRGIPFWIIVIFCLCLLILLVNQLAFLNNLSSS